MGKNSNKKELPINSLSSEERENVWDDAYIKEEGIILDFNPETNIGKIKSLSDESVYSIDSRELIRTKIELCSGDKVFFAPIEDPAGQDFARIIRIIALHT